MVTVAFFAPCTNILTCLLTYLWILVYGVEATGNKVASCLDIVAGVTGF